MNMLRILQLTRQCSLEPDTDIKHLHPGKKKKKSSKILQVENYSVAVSVNTGGVSGLMWPGAVGV